MLEHNAQNLNNAHKIALIKHIDRVTNLMQDFKQAVYDFENINIIYKTILYIPVGMMLENKYLCKMKSINAELDKLNKELNNLNKNQVWTK